MLFGGGVQQSIGSPLIRQGPAARAPTLIAERGRQSNGSRAKIRLIEA
jgi:hypothetical protein